MPRVVLGLPMYRSEASVARALGSLLAQDYEGFAVVAIDDCSPDGTLDIARNLAESDRRITVESNSMRLGMVANWNRVYERACELYAGFEFFAWASDNDLREPSWLSTLVGTLDENPSAALACTRLTRVDGKGRTSPVDALHADLEGTDPIARLRRVLRGIQAGSTVYGLQRRSMLERTGGIPRVLEADRLFLAHLSLHGQLVQAEPVLWFRGPGGTGRLTFSPTRGALRAHADVYVRAGGPPTHVFADEVARVRRSPAIRDRLLASPADRTPVLRDVDRGVCPEKGSADSGVAPEETESHPQEAQAGHE